MKKTAKTAPLPPVDEALAALARRELRAVILLIARLIAVAVLITLLEMQVPALRRAPFLPEAVGGALILWPFFTARGRNAAWRIALGRSYARAKRWAEAERTLRPFARRAALGFDAAGEGAYWLAVAQRALGREEEARRLFQSVARTGRGEWKTRAEAQSAAASGSRLP